MLFRFVPIVFALSLCLGFSTASCVKAPPTLSPVATTDFNKTRVIAALDIVRDAAIKANEPPQVLSEASVRVVVKAHESLLKVIQATDAGWQNTVTVGLEEMLKNLPANDAELLRPYVTLAETILAEAK